MAGTKAGGQKAAQTNKEKYGADFYANIGKRGGSNSGSGGFKYALLNYSLDDPRHPSNAGRKGGAISKRGSRIKKVVV